MKPSDKSENINTLLVQSGKNPKKQGGFVNPPIQRGSTIIFDKAEDLYDESLKSYGLEGSQTHDSLCEALNDIMGGVGTILCPSGLSAITTTLLAFLKAGDHILITDSAYGPTSRFSSEVLAKLGVEIEYYEPRDLNALQAAIKPNTKMIWLESPGSLTIELQDVPAIVAIAKAKNILTAIDDTWSAGIYLKPLLMGVDFSIQALTKYQGGHSDVLLGSVTTNKIEYYNRLEHMHRCLGLGVSAEEAFLCLRGIRSMAVRLAHQDKVARNIAQWLEQRPEVAKVLHPALASSQDNAIFKRDFTGAGALFSIILKPLPEEKIMQMLNSYKLFAMGFSWGGYESLVINCNPQLRRKFLNREFKAPLIRYSIGLEDERDLIKDLEIGFAALNN